MRAQIGPTIAGPQHFGREPDEVSFAPPKPKQRLVMRLGKKLRHPINRIIAGQSLVSTGGVIDADEFPWATELEASYPTIRAELDRLLIHESDIPSLVEISRDQRRIAQPGKWKSFFLYGFGYRSEGNCKACPGTAAAVEAIPGMLTAYFSILSPGTHIPRHRGISKALITAHLGLVIPGPSLACRMDVDGRLVGWKEGRLLFFDDSYHHEVWNDAQSRRVVLLIHFRRPMARLGSAFGGLFLSCVRLSSYVQNARRNMEVRGVPGTATTGRPGTMRSPT